MKATESKEKEVNIVIERLEEREETLMVKEFYDKLEKYAEIVGKPIEKYAEIVGKPTRLD